MEYFIDAVKNNYTNFTGRARRKAFWMFTLFYFIIIMLANIVDAALGIQLVSSILSLALFIPSISIAARRLHDTGRSGWWQLIMLIPLIGLIVLIVFYTQDSHASNKYGNNPKEIGEDVVAP